MLYDVEEANPSPSESLEPKESVQIIQKHNWKQSSNGNQKRNQDSPIRKHKLKNREVLKDEGNIDQHLNQKKKVRIVEYRDLEKENEMEMMRIRQILSENKDKIRRQEDRDYEI